MSGIEMATCHMTFSVQYSDLGLNNGPKMSKIQINFVWVQLADVI